MVVKKQDQDSEKEMYLEKMRYVYQQLIEDQCNKKLLRQEKAEDV